MAISDEDIVYIRDRVYTNETVVEIKATGSTYVLDTNAYAAEDFIHDNLITFDAFLGTNKAAGSVIEIVKAELVETITTGSLQKSALKLYVWDSTCDVAPTKNSAFTIGTISKIHNCVLVLFPAANYKDCKSGATTYDSKCEQTMTGKYLRNTSSTSVSLSMALVTDASTPTYPAGTILYLRVWYRCL